MFSLHFSLKTIISIIIYLSKMDKCASESISNLDSQLKDMKCSLELIINHVFTYLNHVVLLEYIFGGQKKVSKQGLAMSF